MKKKLPLLSNAIVFIVGLLLVLLHDRAQILETIIIIIGIMLIVPSCLALLSFFVWKVQSPGKAVVIVPVIGGLVLGVALVAVPSFFIGFLAYTFAILLIMGGLVKLWYMLSVGKAFRFPIALYAVPVALLVCGIIILSTSVKDIEATLVLITGIAFIAYAFNSLLECIVYRRYLKASGLDVPDATVLDIPVKEIGSRED